ncbi:MAG: hypothetical protein PHS33_08340 [Candidatus Omnitrophica bacterium]|nr:hypothetical protein [Candidatus Omnitrophota bacterium]
MNNLISTGAFTWESSSTAGSTDAISVVTSITKPSPEQKKYVLEVQNNSSESSLNVYLYVKEQFSTSISWCALDSFAVSASPDTNNPDQTGKKSAGAVIIEGAHIALGMGMTAVLNSSITSGAVGSQTLTNPWKIREW